MYTKLGFANNNNNTNNPVLINTHVSFAKLSNSNTWVHSKRKYITIRLLDIVRPRIPVNIYTPRFLQYQWCIKLGAMFNEAQPTRMPA